MNKKTLLVIILALTALIVAGCSSTEEVKDEKILNNLPIPEDTSHWQTKSSGGVVMVDLTPEEYINGKLLVEMSVNTHSVDDLDTYDLKEIVVLQHNGGEYKPVEAPSLSGHHGGGELTFELPKEPKEFSITITNLHDVGVREFNWP